MLTRFFLTRSAKELGVDAKRISEAALQRLVGFDFPGNVRQLENLCHWITVMAPAQVVEVEDLPPELLASSRGPLAAAATHSPAAEVDSAVPSVHTPPGPAVAQAMPPPMPVNGHALAPEDWVAGMEREVRALLASGQDGVWDALTRRFEARMITAALDVTRGRRIEAAQRLGIGRNTITRKIQELGLDDE